MNITRTTHWLIVGIVAAILILLVLLEPGVEPYYEDVDTLSAGWEE